ncbi:MAG: hypothetical protein J6Y13_03405 [Treponema sp.]|nr:hypothetical protein [Treponema sp.]
MLADVEPHIVYDFSTGEAGEQYLVVFMQTENCGGVKSVSLWNAGASLRWQSLSVTKAYGDCYFSVFSPAPGSVMPSDDYELTLTDIYGTSARMSFSLRYDGAMASRSRTELMASESFLRRYAYFDKSGRLAIFGEIDKDSSTQKANKHINGKRFCCISPDGDTVCLFPFEVIP